jgi:tRNA pseudouridine13 synthase
MTIRNVPIQQLTEAASKLGPNLRIGMFRPSTNSLDLGHLTGNHFTIVLRAIRGWNIDEVIRETAETVKKSGFLNYCGMQSFGVGLVPSHMIWLMMLKGECGPIW